MSRSQMFGLAALALALSCGAAFPAVVAIASGGGAQPNVAATLIAAAALFLGGVGLGTAAGRRPRVLAWPGEIRTAALVAALVLAFCALEAADGLINRRGRLFYWNSFLFPPLLLVYLGLLFAQRWAWHALRALAALGSLWFVAFALIIPFAEIATEGVPVPWYGRIYMIGLSLVFACGSAVAFRALGRAESRSYFAAASASQVPADR